MRWSVSSCTHARAYSGCANTRLRFNYTNIVLDSIRLAIDLCAVLINFYLLIDHDLAPFYKILYSICMDLIG